MKPEDSTTTPMMSQYLEIKARHKDALLFYRMGDFYEMFFQDAVLASQALDIALTKRGMHQSEPISMCGVPYHAAEGYLHTLIRKGFRVAIAEQLEDPSEAKKRGYKSVVRRDVVRLITPGTLTEDSLLEPRSHNFLAAFAEVRDVCALAWVDVSTGELRVMTCPLTALGPELSRLAPSELLVADKTETLTSQTLTEFGGAITPLDRVVFDSTSGEQRLCKLFQIATLDAFGAFDRAEIGALGALISYLELTQQGKLPFLRAPIRESLQTAMQIDAVTRRSLEITTSMSGVRDGSLLDTIDKTVTAPGARLLERRISSPSREIATIHARLACVRHFAQHPQSRDSLRSELRRVPDMDRALSRLALERGGPRDLGAIRVGLKQAEVIARALADAPPLLQSAAGQLVGNTALIDLLDGALMDEPGLFVRDGGFIQSGFDPDLDQTRRLRDEGRSVVAQMQADYVALSEIAGLKIKHNNVLGYFIETTTNHADKLLTAPLSATFIHRQTTANQVRFTTVALSDIETKILNAGNHALEVEKRHFETLRTAVLAKAGQIGEAARALAETDVAVAFAELAVSEAWTEPLVDESRDFMVIAGRHPVVERAMRRGGSVQFVANDCALTEAGTPAIWLLTGPNMAGKSTFLRQNALIALLAQAGSFVPASSARIGLVSQLFSRVGASDDLARGRSTFMVEMVETAAILNQADDRALVILDEIGRGTATYDGLSIAWATMEHLHEINRCRALFATHYHEMTALASKLAGVENATVTVKEWDGEVIFLHEVRKGAADRSYGVQVAKLAGLPASVIERAKVVLEALESGERQGAGKQKALIDDLPLFRTAPALTPPRPIHKPSVVEGRLRELQPDSLTPREALALLYELKSLI